MSLVFRQHPAKPWTRSVRWIACWLILCNAAAFAQQVDLVRPADTSSPRATLKSLIDSGNEFHQLAQSDNYFRRNTAEHRALGRRVLDCIDDSELPEFAREEAASEAAICIKEILDRVELPPEEDIPDLKMIEEMEGGLDRWQVPGTRLTIVRVAEGPRKHEYLFSTGTVERAVEYFLVMESLPYRTTGRATSPGFRHWYLSVPADPWVGQIVDRLPSAMKSRALGLAYWKWVAMILLVVITVALLVVIYRLQRHYSLRFCDDRPYLYALTIVLPIMAELVPLLLLHLSRDYVSLRGNWLYAVGFFVNLLELVTSVILVFSIVNRIASLVIASPRINAEGLDAQFIRILSKIFGLVISVLVFLEGGQYLGIPITTLLASAGVGGLAVALAAQDTLKNLFGTIMLMADKPFRVGERIQIDSYDGIVEDIGLRSTRIRLLNGHQVTIPNDTLACNDIENVGRRPFIRRVSSIHIPLDTPRASIEKAVESIRVALENHEGSSDDRPPRVYFDEFNDDSFNIKMMYWFHPADYWAYLVFTEKLNLKIMRAFEQQQIHFSMPMRVTHATFESREEPLEVKVVESARQP